MFLSLFHLALSHTLLLAEPCIVLESYYSSNSNQILYRYGPLLRQLKVKRREKGDIFFSQRKGYKGIILLPPKFEKQQMTQ
jgi:hypothetical protein